MNKTHYCLFIIIGILLSVVLLHSRSYLIVHTDKWECNWTTDSFILQWRHSVEKQLWQEHYQLKDDKLILSHSFVQSFGAGVPTLGKAIPAPKGFVGMEHNLTVPKIDWVVSSRMQGVLIDPNTNHHLMLYRYVDDYTSIHIDVAQKPALLLWLNKMVNAHSDCQKAFT